MDKWIIHPYEIDFNEGTLSTFDVGVPTPYLVENAVYQEGNLMFYVNSGRIYDASGQSVTGFGDPYAMLKEIAIAPVPGSCNTWCVFWLEIYPLVDLCLKFIEVTVEPDGISTGQGGTVYSGATIGNYGGLAISPVISGTEGDRYIYLVAYSEVRKYRMSALSVYLEETTGDFPVAGDEHHEADLSPGGDYLVWNDGASVVVMNVLDLQSPFYYSLPLSGGAVYGTEFSADGQYVYFSKAGEGLYRWDFLAGSSAVEFLAESNAYDNTQLELAKDGYIYAVRNDGILGRINELTVSESPWGIKVYSNMATPVSLPYYALPDQIDGQDYTYFAGVSELKFDAFTINDSEVFDFIDATHPPLLTYNCSAIELNTQTSGTVLSHSIHIYSVDPVTGEQISGPNFLDYTLNGTGELPQTIDLRCLQNAVNCDLFSAYINPPYTTFAVEVSLDGLCETVTELGYIEVQDAPEEAQIGLSVNSNSGVPCPASHDIAMPCQAGIFSASINLANSNGDISYYQLMIEEVDCATGNVLSVIYIGDQVPVSDVSSLTALPLNGLEINGATGYFAATDGMGGYVWLNRCLRITAEVGNACGSSSDYTYLHFDGTYGNGSGVGQRSSGDSNHRRDLNSVQVSAWPNPFGNELNLEAAGKFKEFQLGLFDLQGKPVAFSQNRKVQNEMLQISLNTHELASGVYFLRWIADTESGVIRLVKP